MFNIKVAFLLLGFMVVGIFGSTPFSDCGSSYWLKDVEIDGCDALPCVLVPGTKKTVHFEIYAKSPSQHFTQDVKVIIRGINIPLEVSPENPCDQIACPVINSHTASFNATMDLDNEELTAQLNGELLWILRNENGEKVMCMVTKVFIKLDQFE